MAVVKPPFKGITDVYETLLRGTDDMPIGLYHLYLARAEQLCRLHYSPGTLNTVKDRMLTLSDQGYVRSDGIATKKGKSPYYYALTNKGMDFHGQLGYDTYRVFRFSNDDEESPIFVRHTLEVNDVVIAAALLKKVEPLYSLNSFIHEHTLNHKPYKGVWQGKRFKLIPDAFLDFRCVLSSGKQRQWPILLEHDRGSEEQVKFREKIRKYIVMMRSNTLKQWLGVSSLTVAFTTIKGEKRREQMREWAEQELASTNEPRSIGSAFCFTSLQRPFDVYHLWLEGCWYTPYEDDQPIALLAGA